MRNKTLLGKQKYDAELRRLIASGNYDVRDGGILVPDMKLTIRGEFCHSVNDGPVVVDRNLVVTEMRNYLLDAGLDGAAAVASWYIALFAGNVTPQDTWTGVNFTANSTEFTNYGEATRQAWVNTAASSGQIDNYASKAAFTIGAGGGTIYGAAMLQASAKSATTGLLAAASRFAASRTVIETDVLNVGYRLALSSS